MALLNVNPHSALSGRTVLTPAPKILSALAIVLSIGLMGKLILPALAIAGASLIIWTYVGQTSLANVARRSLGILPFLLLVVFFGPRGVRFDSLSLAILAKGTFSALVLAVLTCSTPFNELLDGLAHLRFPPMLNMILAFMYRYLETLMEEVKKMERARNLRFFGKGYGRQVKVLGFIIGSLFVRSYERGERVHMAMKLRGYAGQGSVKGRFRPTPWDLVIMSLALASLVCTGVVLICP